MNWIEAEGLETADKSYESQLDDFDGILVPGGFGKRGIEGMLNAIRYAREKKVPYFGICLGMQTACIEFARNVCGLADANSSEFDPATPHRVIYKLRELRGVEELGGTMRLGAWTCKIEPGTLAHKVYGQTEISERHRHRYEFNREYEGTLTAGGLRISGSTPDGTYVEMVEIPDHPYFIGCQFHPEFKSKPLEPHPLFKAFVGAAYENGQKRRREKDAAEVETVPPAGKSRPALEIETVSNTRVNHQGHDGSRRNSLQESLRDPSCPSWFMILLRKDMALSFQFDNVRIGSGTLFLIAGPCVIESEDARHPHGRDHQGRHPLAEPALHLQGLLRQGQPHVAQELSRPGPAKKACAS